MNFLDAVNRMLRMEGVISGDDDNATSFSDTAHNNAINLAQIAIQDELSDYISDRIIPYEEADGYITLVTSQQKYSLNSNFIRMLDESPYLAKVDAATSTGIADGTQLYPYAGGESQLRADAFDYRTATGDPVHYYHTGGTSNQIGIYPVPDSNANGHVYRYDYQKDVGVSVISDVIPFINEITCQAFVNSAAIRFRALRLDPVERKQLYPNGVEKDEEHQSAKARVTELVRREPPVRMYGRKYT